MLWDQVSNAPLPIRSSSSKIGLGSACDDYPVGLTKSELERYAKECGSEKVCQYVSQQTGMDISGWCKGDLTDWKTVAKGAFTYYTGVNVDDVAGLIDENGDIDFKNGFELGGGIAAAAICTSYGLGLVSPICSKVGSFIGGVIYNIGGKFIDALVSIFGSGGEYKAFQPDASWAIKHSYGFFSGKYDNDYGYFAKTKMVDYTSRVFAIRSLSVATISMIDNISKFWLKSTKEKFGKEEFVDTVSVFHRLINNGLLLPRCWADLFVADTHGGWEWITSPEGTEVVKTSMWSFLSALQQEKLERFWWDTYSSKQDEDPSRFGDLEYRINTIARLKTCTPNYQFDKINANEYDNSLYPNEIKSKDNCSDLPQKFCCWYGKEFDSGGVENNFTQLICDDNKDRINNESCWNVICGGLPIYLEAVSFNGDNILYMSDSTCVIESYRYSPNAFFGNKQCFDYFSERNPITGAVSGYHVSGNSVAKIVSTTSLDFWCYIVEGDQFQSMINLWAETLESSVRYILAQMRDTLLGKVGKVGKVVKNKISNKLNFVSIEEDHTLRNVLIGTVLIGSGVTAYVYRDKIKSWWNK